MDDFIRLPRVCASRKQARDIVLDAPKMRILRIDGADTVYQSLSFAEELLSEALHWGFEMVVVRGASTELLKYFRASAADSSIDVCVERGRR